VARRGDANAPQQAFIRKTDLFASAIGIRIDLGSAYELASLDIDLALGGRGLGVGFAGGPGGGRGVEPACEGEPLIVAAIDKSDVLAARRANYPRETCSECPTGCAEPAGVGARQIAVKAVAGVGSRRRRSICREMPAQPRTRVRSRIRRRRGGRHNEVLRRGRDGGLMPGLVHREGRALRLASRMR
jgi:hypothetical protein